MVGWVSQHLDFYGVFSGAPRGGGGNETASFTRTMEMASFR